MKLAGACGIIYHICVRARKGRRPEGAPKASQDIVIELGDDTVDPSADFGLDTGL